MEKRKKRREGRKEGLTEGNSHASTRREQGNREAEGVIGCFPLGLEKGWKCERNWEYMEVGAWKRREGARQRRKKRETLKRRGHNCVEECSMEQRSGRQLEQRLFLFLMLLTLALSLSSPHAALRFCPPSYKQISLKIMCSMLLPNSDIFVFFDL